MFSIIKPRGDIKTNWESVNPVLRLREWGVEWETSVGVGEVKVKIGDGVTHWNDLDYAIANDITKKIIKTFATIPEDQENPLLTPGTSLETLFGQVKRKFDYTVNFMTTLKNMVGDYQSKSFNTGSGTITANDIKNAIDVLEQYKLTTANILDVNDSTNIAAALSANQGRLINEKVNSNTEAINTLNSNLTDYGIPYTKHITNLHAIGYTCFFQYDGDVIGNPESGRSGVGICLYVSKSRIDLIVIPFKTATIYTQSFANEQWSAWYKAETIKA